MTYYNQKDFCYIDILFAQLNPGFKYMTSNKRIVTYNNFYELLLLLQIWLFEKSHTYIDWFNLVELIFAIFNSLYSLDK